MHPVNTHPVPDAVRCSISAEPNWTATSQTIQPASHAKGGPCSGSLRGVPAVPCKPLKTYHATSEAMAVTGNDSACAESGICSFRICSDESGEAPVAFHAYRRSYLIPPVKEDWSE